MSGPTNGMSLVCWVELPSVVDPSGILTSIEGGIDIPFEIKRVFYMHQITLERGGHAHRDTHQLVTAVSGSFLMELTDGRNTCEFHMDDPSKGVYLPPMIYINMREYSPDAVGLVLASTHYDRSKSIRTWGEYQIAVNLD